MQEPSLVTWIEGTSVLLYPRLNPVCYLGSFSSVINKLCRTWLNLNFNQMLSRCQIYFETTKILNYRIELNFLSNMLQILNKPQTPGIPKNMFL
jgi:hypothetical protein